MTLFEDYDHEAPDSLGMVLDADRGSLPYALVHGEALVAAAAWALGEAGVTLVDATVGWPDLAEAAEPVVLHDALCPLTPPDFIATCVAHAVRRDAVVVGVRAVTDTVKRIHQDPDGDRVGAGVDRDALVTVCSPLVLPASAVTGRLLPLLTDEGRLPTTDLAALVSLLRSTGDVDQEPAPASARRVDTVADVRLLEALTRPDSP